MPRITSLVFNEVPIDFILIFAETIKGFDTFFLQKETIEFLIFSSVFVF